MKLRIPKLLLAALLACFICIPGGIAFADVGGFSGDTDYDSGSDYSSSWDDDDDYSSSWDDDDDYSSWDDDDDDDDYAVGSSSSDNDSYSSGSSSSSDSDDSTDSFSTMIGALFLTAAAIGIVMLMKRGRGGKANAFRVSGSASGQRVRLQDSFDASKLRGIEYLLNDDPDFNAEEIRERISNWYVQMQNAWTAKDFEPMRPMFTDALFAQFSRQLDDLVKRGQTNYVDRIAVLSAVLKGWYEEGDKQCLVAEISTRITDYTVEDETGRVVSGSSTNEKFMTYRWILSRSIGVKTKKAGAMTTVNCPNCAATLNINQTSKCPYCDSIVTLNEHDWVITAIQGLSQRTQ